MSTETSIGPGPRKGGNQDSGNADGRGNKTLGEHAMPEPELGSEEAGKAAPEEARNRPTEPDRKR